MAQQSLAKNKIKFLLLEGVHPSAVETLQQAGYTNIEQHPKALPTDELKAAIAEAHFVGIRSRTQLTEDVFAVARKLAVLLHALWRSGDEYELFHGKAAA